MSGPSNPFSEEDDVTLPPRLAADLKALQRTPAVPPAVDRAIRDQARYHFSRYRRIQIWRRVGGGIAAAAVLAIGLKIAVFNHLDSLGPMASSPSPTVADRLQSSAASPATQPTRIRLAAEDIDRNGVVNVLDAFTVARGIKSHHTQPAWDVNHDGVVDQQDVDLIAMTAVRVKGGVQ
jgi:hypothetical protein